MDLLFVRSLQSLDRIENRACISRAAEWRPPGDPTVKILINESRLHILSYSQNLWLGSLLLSVESCHGIIHSKLSRETGTCISKTPEALPSIYWGPSLLVMTDLIAIRMSIENVYIQLSISSNRTYVHPRALTAGHVSLSWWEPRPKLLVKGWAFDL